LSDSYHKGQTSSQDALLRRLPKGEENLDYGELLDRFLDYVKEKRLTLYTAQEEAMLALYAGHNVILNTPTGSGKSLVATALKFLSLSQGRKVIYTCPIKALVNEKFLALCEEFGAENVGMITGDASVNKQAKIICCTAEILFNMSLSQGKDADVHDVIMDEFHYYADKERGVAWQVPILTMPHVRFLLISATFGDTDFFQKCLFDLTAKETVVIKSDERPVPLHFVYQETLLHETIRSLLREGKAPIYLVNFTQRECAEEAQKLLSEDVSSKEEKQEIGKMLLGFKFSSPYGKEVQKLLRHGIGIHHAGMLPKYRLLVEQIAQKGLLKVICGTDTLGVGVNIPIRTVIFSKLCKFTGEKTSILSVREFQQISGRAGRRGFDSQGTVVIQAPEHVVENLRLESKAAGDSKKLRKIVKKKPPEKGYVHWDINTFNRLVSGPPEPLSSSFKLSYSMLLQVLSRPVDGCKTMKNLIKNSHESPKTKIALRKSAFQMFRALRDRDIVKFDYTLASRHKQIVINDTLQIDFSLNHTLSLYLLDTLRLLDQSSPDYAVDLLSLVESILENPEIVLRRQVDKLATLKLAEMKADGIEYDERMEELSKIEHPKPNRDFIYETFNQFSALHPWVGTENIRPKSIARDMYETFQSFNDYIGEYGLQRGEGVLLRYLSEVYKVLVQTVPREFHSEETKLMIEYIGSAVRGVDSSLLDEWERIRGLALQGIDGSPIDREQVVELPDITKNFSEFSIKIRNEVFRFLRFLAAKDYESAMGVLEINENNLSSDLFKSRVQKLEQEVQPFYEEHSEILTDRQARHPNLCKVVSLADGSGWAVSQVLTDSENFNDWEVNFKVDKVLSKELFKVVLILDKIGSI
jgi:superfamily II RNA helicase